jgi:hypothetical protein
MPPKKTAAANGESGETGGVSVHPPLFLFLFLFPFLFPYLLDKDYAGANNYKQKFTWEGPNDTKLLLLTQGRYVKTDEYEALSSAFPGTTTGSICNRISALSVKQRNAYEELGWELPEGGAGHSAKKKRGAEDAGQKEGTPSKKARVKKGAAKAKNSENEEEGEETEKPEKGGGRAKKAKEEEEEEVEGEGMGMGVGAGVKEEQVEDDEI